VLDERQRRASPPYPKYLELCQSDPSFMKKSPDSAALHSGCRCTKRPASFLPTLRIPLVVLDFAVVMSSTAKDLSDPSSGSEGFLKEFTLSHAAGFEMTCAVSQLPNNICRILHIATHRLFILRGPA